MKKNRFIKFFISALMILCAKVLLQTALERFKINSYFAYGIVHVIVFFISYFTHLKFTFNHAINFNSLLSYFKMVFVFKLIDYLVFAVVFGFFEVSSKVSIFLATLFLFLIRFSALDKKFKPKEID